MYIDLSGYLAFLLIMLRMTGMLVMNPVFGRRNVPVTINMALAFLMAVLLTGVVAPPTGPEPTFLEFLFLVAKEFVIGMIAGMILQLILSVLVVGGEIIDMEMGISMAKAFDPGTNTSISVTAGFFNAIFIIIFFTTGNHLTFIALVTQTFNVIPLGGAVISRDFLYYLPSLFSQILIYAIKLCLPLAVMEIVVTMAVGIIMRIIPQINIFVINIQFKLMIGMLALVTLVPVFIGYFENMIIVCFERIHEAWVLLL